MADTPRTLTEILTLMADNTTGAISPQDIRDMIVSIAAANGRLSIGSSAATTIAAAGTYYKAAGTTTPGADPNYFTEATSNRLTYTGAPTRHVEIIVSATVSAVGTDQIVGMKIYHNGTEIASSLARTIIKASGNAVSITSHADVHMATDDYLEVFVTNESNTGAVTVEQYYFSVKSLFGG